MRYRKHSRQASVVLLCVGLAGGLVCLLGPAVVRACPPQPLEVVIKRLQGEGPDPPAVEPVGSLEPNETFNLRAVAYNSGGDPTYEWSATNGTLEVISTEGHTVKFTPEGTLGEASVTVEYSDDKGSDTDTVIFYIVAYDLDIDSDNDGEIAEDDDLIEYEPGLYYNVGMDRFASPQFPGKLVPLNQPEPNDVDNLVEIKLSVAGGNSGTGRWCLTQTWGYGYGVGQVWVWCDPNRSEPNHRIDMDSFDSSDTSTWLAIADMPDTLYVEGIAWSSHQGFPLINFHYDPDVGGDGDRAFWDAVAVTVFRLDIDTDSDNSGSINDADDPIEANSPGRLLAVNDDDDNDNGVPDLDDVGPVTNENDLAEIDLTFLPDLWRIAEGRVRLEASSGGQRVRVWSDRLKGDPNDPNILIPLPSPEWPNDVPSPLYVEGIEPGSVMLDLVLRYDGREVNRDKIALTVIKINIDTDTNNDDAITTEDDWIEEYAPGCIIMANHDDDDENMTQDWEEYPNPMENDLEEVNLQVLGAGVEGIVTLTASDVVGSQVRVWDSFYKYEQVELPKTWNLYVETLPESLWVEGLWEEGTGAGYQVTFTLTYEHNQHVVCSDVVAMYVTKPFSWSPCGNFVASWWPCRWPLTPEAPGALPDAPDLLDVVKDQGYNVTALRFEDLAAYDNDVDGCTLAHFKLTSGMQVVSTHGEPGALCVVYFKDEPNADAWRATETGMSTVRSAMPPDGWGGYYVEATDDWFVANWKPQLDVNRSIVYVMACEAAAWPTSGLSIIEACGGRVGFACGDESNTEDDAWNINELFSRMNGTKALHLERTAREAYNGTTYRNALTMVGNGWTTLCPSPFATFPSAYPPNSEGWGCAVFDTYMDEGYPAAEALIRLTGEAAITDQRWARTNADDGWGILGFEFCGPFGGADTVVRAVTAKCKNQVWFPGANRVMDADCVDPADPNENREWYFHTD